MHVVEDLYSFWFAGIIGTTVATTPSWMDSSGTDSSLVSGEKWTLLEPLSLVAVVVAFCFFTQVNNFCLDSRWRGYIMYCTVRFIPSFVWTREHMHRICYTTNLAFFYDTPYVF